MRSSIIDTALLRRRRAELSMSIRQTGEVMGTSVGGYVAVENGRSDSEVTLGAAKRLADSLGLSLDELAPGVQREAAEQAQDDASVLGAVLVASETLTPMGALCDILGWDLVRVHAAESELARRLPLVGMRLRRSMARLAITRDVEAADLDAVRESVQRHLSRNHVGLTEARLMRHIAYGDVPTQPSNSEQKAQGVVVNAGLVTFGPPPSRTAEAPLLLTEDVRYSLMLDEEPADALESAPRARRSRANAPGGPGRPRRPIG